MKNPEFIIFTGPMASSKTSSLLMMLERFKYQNKRVIAFKPVVDDRYAVAEIVSHNGFRHSAVPISSGAELLKHLVELEDGMPEAIAVDEAFMIPGVSDSLVWLYRNGFTIVVSTLDFSANGRVFDELQTMLPWATRIEKLTAVCTVCGADARYTHRKNMPIDDDIHVGGLDVYEPRCWQHCVTVNLRDA